MSDQSDSHSRHNVRFTDGQNDECNKIHVEKANVPEADVEIHAGFFKSDHKYEINLNIDDEIGVGDGAKFEAVCKPHFTLKELHVKTSMITMIIEYFPLMDGDHGVVKELFKITSSDGTKELRVIFRAEVLAQGQGTPMLKDGVRCIQRPSSSTSSVSSQ